MNLKCSICEMPLSFEDGQLVCSNGHLIEKKYDVHILQDPKFADWYSVFESKFRDYRERENLKIKDVSVYDKLPNVANELGKGFWRAKAKDLQLIKKYLKGKSNLNVLEIGAWNCWLTNHLSKMGHTVTAVDYFIDPFDGLGAKQHYSKNDWMAIQMNLERLDLIEERYDVIIINRMVVYFENPFNTLQQLIKKNLKENGEMIVTGVIMTKDKKKASKEFDQEMEAFERKEGFSLKIKAFFGAFTQFDIERVSGLDFKIGKYSNHFLSKIKNLVNRQASKQVYFLYKKKSNTQ